MAAEEQPEGFPRVHAVAKWFIIVCLAILSILAAAFWTMVLGGFADAGFRAQDTTRGADPSLAITPDCAWPYSVNDPNARAMCRMFSRLTPEQREEVLRKRR